MWERSGDRGARRRGTGAARLLAAGLLAAALLLAPSASEACPTCRLQVKRGIYDANFAPRLAIAVAPFGATAAIVGAAFVIGGRRTRPEKKEAGP